MSDSEQKKPDRLCQGLKWVEDRVRTGDLWNHNPAL